jgi:hypothetical protein
MKQEGYSLSQICQEYGVELQILEQFLPKEAPPVIKESVVGFEAQIEELESVVKSPLESSAAASH